MLFTSTFGAEPPKGSLAPLPAEFKPALDDTILFYPGETLSITLTQQVDANHRFWQERPCDWFGFHCWYEQHNASNYVGPNRLPVEFRLVAPDGKSLADLPSHDIQAADGAGNAVPAFQAISPDVPVQIAPNSWTWSSARIGYKLMGRVSGRLDHTVPASAAYDGIMNRQRCSPAPTNGTCSDGQYIVTVASIDVSERLSNLNALLQAQRRDASEIVSADFIDENIRKQTSVDCSAVADKEQCKAPAARAANMLWRHVMNPGNNFSGNERERVLRFALELNPADTNIRNDLTSSLIDRGAIGEAKQQSATSLDKATKDYNAPGGHTLATACTYGRALTNSAKIWLKDRVGTQPADIAVSADLYDRAVKAYAEYRDKACENATTGDSSGSNPDTVGKRLADALIDKARVLGLLRTRQFLLSAAGALVDARKELIRQQPASPPKGRAPFETVGGTTEPAQARTSGPTRAATSVPVPSDLGELVAATFGPGGNEISVLGKATAGASPWKAWRSGMTQQPSAQLATPAGDCPKQLRAPQLYFPASGLSGAYIIAGAANNRLVSVNGADGSCADIDVAEGAVIGLGDTGSQIFIAKKHHRLLGSDSISIEAFTPGAGSQKGNWDISVTGTFAGELQALRLSEDGGRAALLVHEVGKMLLFGAPLSSDEKSSWTQLCAVETTTDTGSSAIARDLRTAAWIEMRGSVVALRTNHRDQGAGCTVRTEPTASWSWTASEVLFSVVGERGLIAYDPSSTLTNGAFDTLLMDFQALEDPAKTVRRSEFVIGPLSVPVAVGGSRRLLGTRAGTVIVAAGQ